MAIKVTNNSEKDIVFGKDAILSYENGTEIYIIGNDRVFKKLKQSGAAYLFYLLLTPLNLTINTSSQSETLPVGLVLGPAASLINMGTAGSANKKFKSELILYNILGKVIKKGETRFGLIGFKADSSESLKLKIP